MTATTTAEQQPVAAPPKPRGPMAYLSFLVTLGLIGALLYSASLVDDWSRDLSTNFAETTPLAGDEHLRPTFVPLPPQEAADLIRQAAATLPRWTEQNEVDETGSQGAVLLEFVRTTPLMRYRDDVKVRVAEADGGSLIHVQSKSRVGKGDLGQNPRNIRELLGAVVARAPAKAES